MNSCDLVLESLLSALSYLFSDIAVVLSDLLSQNITPGDKLYVLYLNKWTGVIEYCFRFKIK